MIWAHWWPEPIGSCEALNLDISLEEVWWKRVSFLLRLNSLLLPSATLDLSASRIKIITVPCSEVARYRVMWRRGWISEQSIFPIGFHGNHKDLNPTFFRPCAQSGYEAWEFFCLSTRPIWKGQLKLVKDAGERIEWEIIKIADVLLCYTKYFWNSEQHFASQSFRRWRQTTLVLTARVTNRILESNKQKYVWIFVKEKMPSLDLCSPPSHTPCWYASSFLL